MRFIVAFLIFILLFQGVFATGISNVPSVAERDFQIYSGLKKVYNFHIYGADIINATLFAPPEVSKYISFQDPAPLTGPRSIRLEMNFVEDAKDIPPGVYTVWFSAREIQSESAQIGSKVTVSLRFVLRKYSDEAILDLTDIYIDEIPEGYVGNYTAIVVSRSLNPVQGAKVQLDVLGDNGETLASGTGNYGVIESGEEVKIFSKLATQDLEGGVYKTRALLTYGGPERKHNKSILRIGKLTIDLLDGHTKKFIFNQTNKFKFKLKSNWNKPLTNVLATVNLVGQSKRAAPESMGRFGVTEQMEVYFDRTETPPGQIEGTVDVEYQELQETASEQVNAETHRFSIPIYLDVVVPEPAKEPETPFELRPIHIVIGCAILLLLLNIVVLFFLLRKKKKE